MYIAVRFPGEAAAVWNFRFIHDTGCSRMTMFEGDIADLAAEHFTAHGVHAIQPPLMGVVAAAVADGRTVWWYMRLMQVTMFDDNDQRMEEVQPWDLVEVSFMPGNSSQQDKRRLDGNWTTNKFYTATSPDGSNNVYIFDKQTGFGKYVPKVGSNKRGPPAWRGAWPAVAWPPAPARPVPGAKRAILAKFVTPAGAGIPAPARMPGGRHGTGGGPNKAVMP